MNKKSLQESVSSFTVHAFVCTNQKAKGECCAPKGADELHAELKAWANSHPAWKGKIRINRSGCLDRCSQGVAVAIYPQNEWLLDVDTSNLDEVKAKIERLMAES